MDSNPWPSNSWTANETHYLFGYKAFVLVKWDFILHLFSVVIPLAKWDLVNLLFEVPRTVLEKILKLQKYTWCLKENPWKTKSICKTGGDGISRKMWFVNSLWSGWRQLWEEEKKKDFCLLYYILILLCVIIRCFDKLHACSYMLPLAALPCVYILFTHLSSSILRPSILRASWNIAVSVSHHKIVLILLVS